MLFVIESDLNLADIIDHIVAIFFVHSRQFNRNRIHSLFDVQLGCFTKDLTVQMLALKSKVMLIIPDRINEVSRDPYLMETKYV